MPRLIILLVVAAVVYILYRRAQGMPPHLRKAEYIKLALGITVVVVILATLTGRMHWIGAAFTGLLVAARQLGPLLLRLSPMLAGLRGGSAASSGQSSTVESAILRMQLDHDSGTLEGEVLKGAFGGWRLGDMDKEQLRELYDYCCGEDQDSQQLLLSYLQQRFPGENDFDQQNTNSGPSGNIERTEALAVLGLDDGATEEEIVAAHRKLIQKIHPDRGGSDYLAAKINQAKDFLLS